MSTLIKDLGAVSAYAYAVEKGYTGTEDEFASLMYDYTDVIQIASEARDGAVAANASAQEAKTEAQTASNTANEAANKATSKASEASASVTEAGKATNAAVAAKTAAETAQQRAETAQQASEDAQRKAEIAKNEAQENATIANNKASKASQYATTATNKASEASTSAKNAKTYSEQSQASATTANTKADEASASANSARVSADNAQQSATNAQTYMNSSSTSASKAQANAEKTQSDKEAVESAKSDVLSAVDNAQNYANSAQSASQAIQNMNVEATTLEPDSDATVEKTVDAISGAVTLTYGIPKGQIGEKGDKGDTGDSGVYIGTSAPLDTNVNVWIDSDGEPDDVIQIDDTLTQSGQAADAKVVGDEIEGVKGDVSGIANATTTKSTEDETVTTNYTPGFVNLNGVVQQPSETYKYTGSIEVKSGDVIRLTNANHAMRFITAYSNGSAVSSLGSELVTSYTVPDGIDSVVITIFTVDTFAQIIRAKSIYVNALTEDVNALKDDVSEILIKSISENIFDGTFVVGEQVATSSGAFVDGAAYARTNYIPIKAGTVHIGANTTSTVPTVFVHCALCNKNKSKLSAFPYTGITVNSALDLQYQTVTAEEDGYIAFDIYKPNVGLVSYYVSQVEVPSKYVAYHEPEEYINPDLLPDVENNAITASMTYGKTPLQAKKDSFVNGEVMVVESNSILKNQEITFFAKINSFGSLYVGHGQADYGYYVKIDDTNITYMSNGNAGTAIPHGLTIESYISVIIKVNNIGTMTVIVNTLNGSKIDTRGTWSGRKGEVFAKSENSTFANAILTWNSNDYKKAIWAFGDSYFANNTGYRWTYWLVSPWGFDTMLLNSYPGEASGNAYNDLITALTHGTPKYLLWCLGMNDHDTGTEVNSVWLEKVQAIETICEEKGITLILATIPNVTNTAYNNTFKNQYVIDSGYRYVDFAGAVDGVSGWLSDDGVHPSEVGARLLAAKAIADCPELIQES